ncbi:MAG: 2-oxo acid dehydrogenase subunit E2 [Planctomycetes bacterium]|nr:2-oxo acid dehydrogenase subunit E2 [Planctomycetota bacterium]
MIKQPKDKSHFILPDLGEGVAEAELIRWQVKAGDQVQEHQTLAEMETDKALVEVPSPWDGVIGELHGEPGDIIAVGSVLVSYRTDGGAAPTDSEPAVVAEDADAGTVVGRVDTTLSVSDTLTRRREPEQAAVAGSKALATPAVRRVARELGIDINQVPGTGRGGRVTAADVHDFDGAPTVVAERAVVSPLPAPTVDSEGVVERIPIRGIRRTIARALERSVRTAVHFTVTDEADVTALDLKRREYTTVLGRKLSFMPIVLVAICKALRLHPLLNSNIDDEKQEILVKGVVNLGIAVDTEHGLMVPVIRNADTLSIAQLGDAVGDVAKRARDRSITREELTGGTFTVSNVGSFGGMHATPIINYPEVAILAMGRAKERVLVREGMFYAGWIMPLSVSSDHRVVDGAESARFLSTVVRLLEQPDALVS